MPIDLTVTLVAVFVSVALTSALIASMALSRTAPALKRLRPTLRPAGSDPDPSAANDSTSAARRDSKPLRKAVAKESRLQRRLASAGWDQPEAPRVYLGLQIALAIACAVPPVAVLGIPTGWIFALLGATIGYLIPDLMLAKKIGQQQKAIQNGLPDALDLLVVCVEAGSSLDQAILRASEELEIALPPMAHQLRTMATEIRAGKPRLEAFQDFAKRTRLDDVRALAAMLIQTDRFGTSIAQALRTHAETVRTKRRQRAEERAGKVGVKLVFPLVLCLLPALYVICLGPIVVRMYRTLF